MSVLSQSSRQALAGTSARTARIARIADRGLAPACSLAAAFLWLACLNRIPLHSVGAGDLVTVLPAAWFVALGLGFASVLVEIRRGDTRAWCLAMGVLAVAAILYATVPAISDAPQYSWTYKHIGVTKLVMARGTVDPSVDLYNRWPGLFAVAAAFAQLAKVNLLHFAGWFEPLFTCLDALLVAAIASTLTRSRRVAGLSALLWLVTNWVGQQYFSPQGLAYTLSLCLLLVILRFAPFGEPMLPAALRRRVGQALAVGDTALEAGAPGIRQAALVALVVLIDAVIVVTHQLTPYMIIAQVAALTLLGLRPRWLVLVVTGLAIAYLVPNYGFLTSHYGSITGFDFLKNAAVSPGASIRPPWIYAHAGAMLTAADVLAGGLAYLWLLRSGAGRSATILAALAAAPLALVAGTHYGGEGPLRVVLFSSAPIAILIADALCRLSRAALMAASSLCLVAATALFMFAFTAFRGTNIVHRDEVVASDYFYTHAPAHSALMFIGEDFPTDSDARYSVMRGNAAALLPNVFPDGGSAPIVTPHLGVIMKSLAPYLPRAYVVFSTAQQQWLQVSSYRRVATPRDLGSLERALVSAGHFKLWYRNRDVRIYVYR